MARDRLRQGFGLDKVRFGEEESDRARRLPDAMELVVGFATAPVVGESGGGENEVEVELGADCLISGLKWSG